MKTLPQSLSSATSSRTKYLILGIKNPMRKLENKTYMNQNLSEGVETFATFVMGETQINIAIIKSTGGKS